MMQVAFQKGWINFLPAIKKNLSVSGAFGFLFLETQVLILLCIGSAVKVSICSRFFP